MKKIICGLFISASLVGCKNYIQEAKTETHLTDTYEITKPSDNTRATLFLFPAYGESIEDTKIEFNIADMAAAKGIAVVYLNFNDKLFLKEEEKTSLAQRLQTLLKENELTDTEVYIGGHSAGGAVSLLIGNFLQKNDQFGIAPKGIFISDSPVDLLALYKKCELKIARDSTETTGSECSNIVNYFNKTIGSPNGGISEYEKFSVYTLESGNIENLARLKSTKLRFYTEPAKDWWKEKFGMNYEETNAYQIKMLDELLEKNNFSKVEYIETVNKGYRADGTRNPHSWSIIDKDAAD